MNIQISMLYILQKYLVNIWTMLFVKKYIWIKYNFNFYA